jgi:TAG lipase/steryl ester hydrolase/phospholipase A2/LPA acyltransferase
MSFVPNTVFTNSSRLHGGNGGTGGSHGVKGASQSSGGLFTPLFQLVRDPYGTIVGTADPQNAPNLEEEEDQEDRKQVLHLHMKDVGVATLELIFTC